MKKNKGVNTTIIVAIIGLIGTLLAALIGSSWFGDVIKKPTPTGPAPTVTATLAGPTLSADATLVFQEDFEDASASGFVFGTGTWEILKDKANHVLQVTSDTPSQSVLAEAVFGPSDFASGIIELKLKFIQPGKVWLNFREQGGPGYYLLLDTVSGQIVLGYKSPEANGVMDYAAIAANSATFDTGITYLVRIEVRGDQMIVSIDNNRAFSAADTRLLLGRLTFTASNGTVATFDDVQVWSFGP